MPISLLIAALKVIRMVRGKGLMIGVEIDPAYATAREVCERLLAHGILTKDTHDTIARFAPPLIIEKPEPEIAVG